MVREGSEVWHLRKWQKDVTSPWNKNWPIFAFFSINNVPRYSMILNFSQVQFSLDMLSKIGSRKKYLPQHQDHSMIILYIFLCDIQSSCFHDWSVQDLSTAVNQWYTQSVVEHCWTIYYYLLTDILRSGVHCAPWYFKTFTVIIIIYMISWYPCHYFRITRSSSLRNDRTSLFTHILAVS